MAKQTLSISVANLASGLDDEVAQFWEFCLPGLRNVFFLVLRPLKITADDAADYAEDLMTEILPRLGQFRNWTIDDVLNYVFKSAFNEANYYLRREIERGKISYQQLRAYAPWIGPATIVDKYGNVIEVASHPLLADPWKHIAEIMAAAAALEELNERDRDVFYLRYILGWDIEETAIITGLSQENVKKIGPRAREKLRKRFEAACANVSTA